MSADFNIHYYTPDGSDRDRNINITMFDPHIQHEGHLSTALTFHAFGLLYREGAQNTLSKQPIDYMPSLYHEDAPRILFVRMDEGVETMACISISNLMNYDDLIVQTFSNTKEEALYDFGLCSKPYHIMHMHPYYIVNEELIRRYDETKRCHHRGFPIYGNKNLIFRLIKKSYIKKTLEDHMEFRCLPRDDTSYGWEYRWDADV